MNRRSWLVLGAGGLVLAAAGAVWVSWPKAVPAPPPVAVPHADLPRMVYKAGSYRGRAVVVAFPLALTATPDPLVWEYRPGWPAEHTPPTYRIHFTAPPVFADRPPHVVTGTVDGIDPDATIRPNGVPGVLVLRASAPASP